MAIQHQTSYAYTPPHFFLQ